MSVMAIRSAGPADEDVVVKVITLAFSIDPVARWANPNPATYLDVMPDFARAFGGNGFAHGSVHIAGDGDGAAMWLPPGVEPDQERMGALIMANAPEEMQPDLFALVERMAEAHPHEPHWYLPLIGVDPALFGKGIGSALMRHALARCDRDGAPAYLESSNPRNISLYRRHGFEAMGTIQVGTSPPIVPMLRRPR
jgi:ribosomal protein S18 acetylase RimI-like enzyme